MTLNSLWRTIGDILQWTFNFLQEDFFLTWMMNTGLVCLGFIGLFYWLNWQRKFNAQAQNDPNQLK